MKSLASDLSFCCIYLSPLSLYLVSEVCDHALGLSLQVHVDVVQLGIQGFVDLLLPIQTTGLLHGLLQGPPVQVLGQVPQEYAHMLNVVQSDAQLPRAEQKVMK